MATARTQVNQPVPPPQPLCDVSVVYVPHFAMPTIQVLLFLSYAT